MNLPNPKELKALLKVCREQGVEELTVGELKVKFGELPQESSQKYSEDIQETMPDGTPLPPGISMQQMIDWSSAPDPMMQRAEQ